MLSGESVIGTVSAVWVASPRQTFGAPGRGALQDAPREKTLSIMSGWHQRVARISREACFFQLDTIIDDANFVASRNNGSGFWKRRPWRFDTLDIGFSALKNA